MFLTDSSSNRASPRRALTTGEWMAGGGGIRNRVRHLHNTTGVGVGTVPADSLGHVRRKVCATDEIPEKLGEKAAP